MPKVSQAHLDARRRQIVEAATALFAQQGFSRTTMADVVTASGLSTGAVYRYFPSKSDLVLAVVAGRDGTIDGQLTHETPVQLVSRLAGYVSPGAGASHAQLIAQIWGDAAVVPELAAAARERHEILQTHLADLLAQAHPEPATDSDTAASTAQVVLASLVGLAALVASGTPVDADTFTQTLTRLLEPPSDP